MPAAAATSSRYSPVALNPPVKVTIGLVGNTSDGGILIAIAEMAMAGNTGARLVTHPREVPGHAFWFGEDQGRYILAVADSGALIRAAEHPDAPPSVITLPVELVVRESSGAVRA